MQITSFRVSLLILTIGLLLMMGTVYSSHLSQSDREEDLRLVNMSSAALIEERPDLAGLAHSYEVSRTWNDPAQSLRPRQEKGLILDGLQRANGYYFVWLVESMQYKVLPNTFDTRLIQSMEGVESVSDVYGQPLYFDPIFQREFQQCLTDIQRFNEQHVMMVMVAEALEGLINLYPECSRLRKAAHYESLENI